MIAAHSTLKPAPSTEIFDFYLRMCYTNHETHHTALYSGLQLSFTVIDCPPIRALFAWIHLYLCSEAIKQGGEFVANIVALVSEMDIPQCIALRIIAVTIIALVYILVHSPADISFHVRNLLSFEVKHFTESHRLEAEDSQSNQTE